MKTKKKDIFNRLKRTEGQIRGIQRMIEEEKSCFDVITQLTAIRSSINSTMGVIIGEKITQVIENPSDDPQLQEERINQAINLIIKK
ncbi:metal-sensitive transcriptional regulator [Streptococcus parauberis]|uniref:Metal-sensitive transcriptional regulator n=1 Tax=Streptococcus parauberis TaxID=1348 RepID=A0AAE4HZI7_9STRE|nr:metal-sensitive transcriptional regulator [Streptococcus parauberis]MDT2732370.1 metal-sensitive transcriptional regulator [Streptococcus parauberis]